MVQTTEVATKKQASSDITIFYGAGTCCVGPFVFAHIDGRLCYLALDTDVQKMREILYQQYGGQYGAVDFVPGDFDANIIDDFVHGDGAVPELDLFWATDFQQKVYDQLMRIPSGDRWSYAQVAQKIQQPKAARAVGSACAKNQIAIFIPCHRVVAKDNKKMQYRWGAAFKNKLLGLESLSCSG